MIGTEGLLSGSAEWASSQSQQRGPPIRLGISSTQARHRGPPLRLDTEGLLPGPSHRASSPALHGALFSDSAERASFYALHRGPPLMLCTEGLLAGSTRRASSQAQQRGPP